MNSIQTFLEEFNCIPFEEKPQILLEAWFKFFAIKRAQPENSNELFQKLLEDLKELAEVFCIHDNVEDLIESALNSKLLSINSNSQRLDKEEQEVKNVVEQSVELGTQDEIECDMPAKDDSSPAFTTFSNPLFNVNDDLDSSDDESLPEEDVPTEDFKVYSNPLFDEDEINSDKLDPHCFNVESDFVKSLLNRDTFIDSSSKFDFSGELAHVNPEITESNFDCEEEIHLSENLMYDNSSSQPPKEHNVEEERIKREHADYISRMEIQDNDSQREEIDIVTSTDDVLSPGVENDDSDEEVDVVDELRVDNSISNSEHEFFESEESDFDNPSVPLPPPEPPDEELDFEIDFGDEISVMRNTIVKFECIDARVKFDDKNDDYSYFMFVKVISFLFAESEDTIFEPGFAPVIGVFLCWIFVPVSKIFTSFDLKLVWGSPYSLIYIA
nr:hypothetical protein [Tanacetum cinerariifolium]